MTNKKIESPNRHSLAKNIIRHVQVYVLSCILMIASGPAIAKPSDSPLGPTNCMSVDSLCKCDYPLNGNWIKDIGQQCTLDTHSANALLTCPFLIYNVKSDACGESSSITLTCITEGSKGIWKPITSQTSWACLPTSDE